MSSRQNRRFTASQRRLQVSELYLKSWTQAAIAAHLNVSQSTVSEDVRYLIKKWEQSAIRNVDELRARELLKLDYMERESWAGWERSQKPAQSAVVTGEGNGQQTRKSMKNQIGDPRFLDQVSKCIAHRRAITGLDSPLQMADVTPPVPEETPEQRKARLDEILRAAKNAFENCSPQRRLSSPTAD
jgi:hypothetical protein